MDVGCGEGGGHGYSRRGGREKNECGREKGVVKGVVKGRHRRVWSAVVVAVKERGMRLLGRE